MSNGETNHSGAIWLLLLAGIFAFIVVADWRSDAAKLRALENQVQALETKMEGLQLPNVEVVRDIEEDNSDLWSIYSWQHKS